MAVTLVVFSESEKRARGSYMTTPVLVRVKSFLNGRYDLNCSLATQDNVMGDGSSLMQIDESD